MNTWRITGSSFFAGSARSAVVDRHVAPAEQHLALVLDRALDLVLAGEARGRLARQEHHADAVLRRAAAASRPACAISSRKNRSGIWISSPAPSDELRIPADRAAVGQVAAGSCRPCSTIACDFLPLMCATKPTPQASCSLRGSYRPCAQGGRGYVAHSRRRTTNRVNLKYTCELQRTSGLAALLRAAASTARARTRRQSPRITAPAARAA